MVEDCSWKINLMTIQRNKTKRDAGPSKAVSGNSLLAVSVIFAGFMLSLECWSGYRCDVSGSVKGPNG